VKTTLKFSFRKWAMEVGGGSESGSGPGEHLVVRGSGP
jgi:hypothetical protein